jgi:peptidoglycan/LPS O-acetylase OafA/YrhL
MKTYVVYLTFIPWILYFISICKKALNDIKSKKTNTEYYKKNFFRIFPFDTLILTAIFVFVSKFYKNADQIWLAKILLFSSINLYLYINTFYDESRKKNRIGTGDISTMLILTILILPPIIFYVAFHMYTITYYILFGYSFFYYPITIISKSLNNLLFKIVRHRNNENK